VRVIVRPQEPRDYEAAKVVYAEAFKYREVGRLAPELRDGSIPVQRG
jgi:hypothetical protein